MTEPPTYGIELNERIKTFDCPDCGEKQMTVWGFVSKDNVAHAIYYAGLMTGHDQTSVRLTVSITYYVDDLTIKLVVSISQCLRINDDKTTPLEPDRRAEPCWQLDEKRLCGGQLDRVKVVALGFDDTCDTLG